MRPGPFDSLVATAAARLGRTVDATALIGALVAQAYSNPMRDSSVEAGRAANIEELVGIGVDEELAVAIHERECEPDFHVPFPETLAFLEALRDRRVVIVSNCCIDLRAVFRHHELDDLIDDYVLSCEHGIVKPDRRLFELALGDIDAADALMVGDSAADAGAIEVGIETILLSSGAGGFTTVLQALGIRP